ncbi:MAG: hypothetical protein ACJ73E_00230 [Mycobacteriales bacterium]
MSLSREIEVSPAPTPTDLFIDRLEALLRSTPGPLRSVADQAGFLGSYVDTLFAHRAVAALLACWPPPPGSSGRQRAREAAVAVQALLAGPDADLERRVRAAVAVAGLAGAVAAHAAGRAEDVRSLAVARSVAALNA